MNLDPHFSNLLRDIHVSAFEPSHWDVVLRKIAREVDATKASMHMHEFAPQKGGEHTAGARLYSVGYDEATAKIYARDFSKHDPYIGPIRKLGGEGRVGISDELISEARLRKTMFYADYGRPNGIHFVGYIKVHENERFGSGLAVIRPENAEQFGQQAIRVLRALLPHLVTAFSHHRRVRSLTDDNRILLKGVDQAHGAVVALDKEGRIINMSPPAKKLLDANDPIQVRAGHLQARDPLEDCKFQDRLTSTLRVWANAQRLEDTGLRLLRRDGKTFLNVEVKPFSSLLDYTSSACALFAEDRPEVLVFLSDPSAQYASLEAVLRSRFEFTPQEARLADFLRRGYKQKDIADELHLSHGSVRIQFHRMYGKASVDGQMALMNLLRSLAE